PDGLSFEEAPSLAERVAAGELPPLADRLPKNPFVTPTNDHRHIGKYGGELRTMVTRSKDTRLLTVYGYARLVRYDEDLSVKPDILEKVEVEDGRIFTLYLRAGHRWSDGHPFTSEDFRYYWEDVANNSDLAPTGPPVSMRVDGELPKVEYLDEVTVRYTWQAPNPFFLSELAGAAPLFIYRPAHYLKNFHSGYRSVEEINVIAEERGFRNWAELHNRLDNLYRFDNPDLPTLQPWMNTVAPPSTRFVAVRNPYFHRVDAEGKQLPYIESVILNVVAAALVPAKSGAGESDLQARGLNFMDFTFLKENEERSGYDVRLWKTVRGSQLALFPNLNVEDESWRELLRDVRFRRALSLAIDREEINAVIYFGLAAEGNNTVLENSPLFDEERFHAWATYDPDLAEELLEELGLDEFNSEDIRVMPDGRPLEIIVETAGESTEESDVLELIHDAWLKIGVKLFTKPSQREVLRNRIFSGATVMAMWPGYENGVPTAEMSPAEFVPVQQHSYQWPKWGQYHETSGSAGEPVDMDQAEELLVLYNDWIAAKSVSDRREIWNQILEIHAEQIFTIGTVAQVPQPVLVNKKLRNVPEEGIFNWDPGANFGIYRPDTFFWEVE
ncbi:MAG: ABC transporter substrate-binding protein, partial [Kiloniellales bacterium]|nr:ABC transporter substrate-binding protein [Kiloniellales bacterium]